MLRLKPEFLYVLWIEIISQFERLSHFIGCHSPRVQHSCSHWVRRIRTWIKIFIYLINSFQIQYYRNVFEFWKLIAYGPRRGWCQIIDYWTQLTIELKATQLLMENKMIHSIIYELKCKALIITYLPFGLTIYRATE